MLFRTRANPFAPCSIHGFTSAGRHADEHRRRVISRGGGMRVRRRVESLIATSALLSVSSCMTVSASVIPTAAGGVPEAVENIRVSALGAPDGARELGL